MKLTHQICTNKGFLNYLHENKMKWFKACLVHDAFIFRNILEFLCLESLSIQKTFGVLGCRIGILQFIDVASVNILYIKIMCLWHGDRKKNCTFCF